MTGEPIEFFLDNIFLAYAVMRTTPYIADDKIVRGENSKETFYF